MSHGCAGVCSKAGLARACFVSIEEQAWVFFVSIQEKYGHAGRALSRKLGCAARLGPCEGLCVLHVANAAAAMAYRLCHRHGRQHNGPVSMVFPNCLMISDLCTETT